MLSRSPSALWMALAYGLFVVYGSLVPLDFRPLPLDEALVRFQRIPYLDLGLASRADWVANGVLYMPLGFLITLAASGRHLPRAVAASLAIIVCTMIALAVEFAQLFFPPRTVSQNDLLAEFIGSVLGALAAPLLSGWLQRLSQAWLDGGARLGWRVLECYSVGYLALCFFPYDLLLSASELDSKWHSSNWSWFRAQASGGRGPWLELLQWGVELCLLLPIGLLWARRRHSAPARLAAAAGFGLLLGLAIEIGQFFVASGISQGVSVLSRALGVTAGAAMLPWLRQQGVPGLRSVLRRLAPMLWAAYLALLLLVNGYVQQPWQDWQAAAAAWAQLRLMPFYYHYYTTEALALFSLGSVALMYMPVAALGWAQGASKPGVVLGSALLAVLIEAGKLLLTGLHPDPSNPLIAAAGCAMALQLISLTQRPASPAALPQLARPPMANTSGSAAWWLVFPAVLVWLSVFPVWRGPLLALLVACAALVWRWPAAALGVLPAALPVLDLAPWSGRLYIDEFDALSLVCIAVAWLRSARPAGPDRASLIAPMTLAFALLGLSLAISSVRGLWPLAWPDANSFAGYHGPWNALRIAKGALWAWLLVLLWQRLARQSGLLARLFSAGMVTGLGLTVLVVLWERLVFTGMADYSTNYRVTGLFSAMHKGGAYIECWLAVASAFALAAVLRGRHLLARGAALLLVAGAGYAVMVTYSRNGYAALAGVLLASLASLVSARRRQPARWPTLAWAAALLAVLASVVLPVLQPQPGDSFARQRLAQSEQDLSVRQAHWTDGLGLRDGSLLTTLFGMGLGSFPERHYWRSAEPVHAASYRLAQEGGKPLLRLGEGATLYIEQIVANPGPGPLRLQLDWRASDPATAPSVMLCEKWTLSSLRCVAAKAQMAPSGTAAAKGAWQHADLSLDTSPLLQPGRGPWLAPWKLSLLTPAKGTLDISRLRLVSSAGDELLSNGDFSAGMDHWLFATDVDPPWHLHSLPVAVLFDQGWFGVLAWSAVLLGAVLAGIRLARTGQAQVPAALPALVGFAACGALNTLIDAPRFLGLLLLLAWLAAVPARLPGAASATLGRRP